ncbi:MAG: protein kinase [Planctomycetota bacterium]
MGDSPSSPTQDPSSLREVLAAARHLWTLPGAPPDTELIATRVRPGTREDVVEPPPELAEAIHRAEADPSMRFGRFLRLGALGAGGMGEVHLAWDPALARAVAVKVVRADVTGGTDPLRGRFLREARLSARLRHPNLVTVYEVGEVEGAPYLAMEYVPGGTLAERYERGRPADLRGEVSRLALVCHAVGYAHAQGIVHRDLKPGNVLLEADGNPRVSDFGLAKDLLGVSTDATASGQVLGTPAYMSPEQASGRPAGPESDVFSLGVILYEILSGKRPFDAADGLLILQRVVAEAPRPLARAAPDSPTDLRVVCAKALEKDPRRRYANATELGDDLERWTRGEPVFARPASIGYLLRMKASKHRLATASLAIAVVALVGSGAYLGLERLARRGEATRLREMGQVAEAAGDLEGALTCYSGAVRLLPEDAEASRLADAAASRLKGLRARAEAEARVHELAMRAQEVLTDVDDIRRRAGVAAAGAALDRVKALCDSMEALLPDSAEALSARGRLWWLRGDRAQAIDALRRALASQPDFLAARFYLAIALDEAYREGRDAEAATTGPREEAIGAFDAVLRAAPEGSQERRYASAALADLSGRDRWEAMRRYGELSGEPGWIGDKALLRRADRLLEARPEDAVRDLELLHTLRPWSDEVVTLLADGYALLGRQEDLRSLLRGEEYGQDSRLHIEGRLKEAEGDLKGAELAYARVLERDPGSLPARVGRGVIRLRRGDDAGALEDLDLAAARRSTFTVVYHRASALAGLGRLAEAEEALESGLAAFPGYAELHLLLGKVLLQRDAPDAAASLEKAAELDPRRAEPWLALGEAYRRAGRTEDALGAYGNASEVDRASRPRALVGMADVYAGMGGRQDRVPVLLDEALRLAPSCAEARIARGNLRVDRGDLDGGVEDYRVAVEADPRSYEGWYNLGSLRELRKEKDLALEAFLRAAAAGAIDADAHIRAGRILATRKEWARLKDLVGGGLERFPDETELTFLRGAARLGLSEASHAEGDFSAVLDRRPDHALARYHRALARLAAGDASGAVDDLETFQRDFPDHPLVPRAADALREARKRLDEGRQ